MRLEHDDRALIVERIHGIQQRAQLTRMVCIIVVQIRALKLALKIKAAACALKSGKTVLDGIRADTEHNGCGRGSERVAHIVNTRHVECHAGKIISPVINIKLRHRAAVHDVLCIDVRFCIQAEGNDLARNAAQSVHGVGIVIICDHGAGFRRNTLGKAAEGMLDILKILEEIQMIRLDVQNHGDRRVERQK